MCHKSSTMTGIKLNTQNELIKHLMGNRSNGASAFYLKLINFVDVFSNESTKNSTAKQTNNKIV